MPYSLQKSAALAVFKKYLKVGFDDVVFMASVENFCWSDENQ